MGRFVNAPFLRARAVDPHDDVDGSRPESAVPLSSMTPARGSSSPAPIADSSARWQMRSG